MVPGHQISDLMSPNWRALKTPYDRPATRTWIARARDFVHQIPLAVTATWLFRRVS